MLDYKQSLTFYTSYHSNPINQLIHFIFVPVIFWSTLVLLCYLPAPTRQLAALPFLGDIGPKCAPFMPVSANALQMRNDIAHAVRAAVCNAKPCSGVG
jgi:Protein of unknown function (DUF962)